MSKQRKDSRLFAKLDLDYADHPKIAGLSDAAFRAHVEMILHSRKYLTDGLIKQRFAKRFGSEAVTELLNNDDITPSLIALPTGDYQLHGFTDMQETRAEVEQKRAVNRENGRRGGLAKAAKAGSDSLSETVSENGGENVAESESETETEKTTNTRSVSPVSDRARNAGLTDRGITSIINTVALHCDIDATPDEAIDLAEHITSKAKTAPRSVPAYVRNAIENGPSEIDAWFRARRRPLKAVGR